MSDRPSDRVVDIWVAHHPAPPCQGFIPKSEPSEYWCMNCGWNEHAHDDEDTRQAILDALARREAPTEPAASLE
jgi:hypothetical protein